MTKRRHNDYSNKMPHLDFRYDSEYYPDDSQLPDPQLDPNIFGAAVTLDKVGVTGVDLPMQFMRRDGSVEQLHVKASLYGSLDNPNAKGLNLSRFPILMHEKIANHMSIDGIKDILQELARKQDSRHVYCKLRFKYPWVQEALRTREELPDDAPAKDVFKVVEGVKIGHKKMLGYIFYDCILEGQLHRTEELIDISKMSKEEFKPKFGVKEQFKFYLTVDYIYSSTCPCSFELAQMLCFIELNP